MVRLRQNGHILGRPGGSTPGVHFGYPGVMPGLNVAPTAGFTTVTNGLVVAVTSTSTDPDGSITSLSWAWGDGTTTVGASPSHTYATAGTYTITLTVTDNLGATATTSASVTLARPVVADPYVFTTSTGQAARIDFPSGWTNGTAVPLVIQSRGVDFNVGGDTFEQPTMSDAALAAGWAFATCAFHGNSYGSPTALADLTALITEAQRVATIGPVVLWGNSMGGMLALNAVTTGTLTPAGVYLTDPVVDLRQRYDNGRAATIQAAFGIASDGSDYAAKTAGLDPALRPAGDFLPSTLRFRAVASTGDTQVPMALHSHVLEAKLGSERVNTRDVGDAGHNTAARFIPADFTAFLTSVLTPDVTAPTAPVLTGTSGDTTVALSWTASTDTVGTVRYRVKRGTTVLTPVALTGTTYTDTGRTNGTPYTYTVDALNAQGLVTTSNTVTVTPAGVVTLPADNFNTDGNLTGAVTSTGGATWEGRLQTGTALASSSDAMQKAGGTAGPRPTGISGNVWGVLNLGATDVTVEVTLASLAAAVADRGGGLGVRVGTDGSGMQLATRVNSTTNGYSLYWMGSGTAFTLITQSAVIPTAGDRLRLVASGTTITAYVNGVQLMQVTETRNATATRAGLFFTTTGAATRFDDFARTA